MKLLASNFKISDIPVISIIRIELLYNILREGRREGGRKRRREEGAWLACTAPYRVSRRRRRSCVGKKRIGCS